ncbi:MAG: hypothetical protein IID40_11195 [Planctomycetes bacterium]|nr:hypothetical protein [Planctomycetota bacterium]
MSGRPKPNVLLALIACLSAAGGCMDRVVARAGANRTVDGGDTVSLDGSDSTPQDRGRLDYLWEVVDGPDLSFASSTARRTTFTAPRSTAETIYRIRLTATYVDLSGRPIPSNRDTDDVIIRVHADPDAGAEAEAEPEADPEPDTETETEAGTDSETSPEDTSTPDTLSRVAG